MLVSISVLFAIKEALNSARKDSGLSGWWTLSKYRCNDKEREIIVSFLDGPATVEHIRQNAGINIDNYTF